MLAVNDPGVNGWRAARERSGVSETGDAEIEDEIGRFAVIRGKEGSEKVTRRFRLHVINGNFPKMEIQIS